MALEVLIKEVKTWTSVKTMSKSSLALLYKRSSKERRKRYPPMPTTLSLYTIHRPPLNHLPCSDVPAQSHPWIIHTISIIPYQFNHTTSPDVTIPLPTSLSYYIILPRSRCFLHISQPPHLSFTQFILHPLCILPSFHVSPYCHKP